MTPRRRFWHVAGAGTAFQAGTADVDSATVMSALVFQLTGSPPAVGAVTTILHMGWLLPQILIGFLAERRCHTKSLGQSGGWTPSSNPDAPAGFMSGCSIARAAVAPPPTATPEIMIRPPDLSVHDSPYQRRGDADVRVAA